MTGERDASFKELYEHNKDRVYNTVLSMLKNVQDAEEVTQDVFIKAYEHIESFKGNAQQSTWLYKIAVNSSIDFLRSKKAQKRFSWLTSLFDPESGKTIHDPAHFDHPGIQAERKEEARLLFQAIDKLPEKQQAAYILHNIEDVPYKEIAVIMDTSISSVESLLFRAKKNLKKILEKVID